MPVLTSEQEAAVVRRSGSLLLAAGAGSGKTSVLVERFVRAVREDGTAPGRILAITFTERAAGELRARVRARLLELGERDAARDMEGAPIGTFHGFCARLLRLHAAQAGLEADFAILDEVAAAGLRALAFRRALAELLGQRRTATDPAGEEGEVVDLLAAYGTDRVRAIVLGAHAELRSRGELVPRLPPPRPRAAVDVGETAAFDDARAARACALIDRALGAFAVHYGDLKRERGALDFDDLELLAARLLAERPGVRAAWSERLELMMVDEFQDTNPRQLQLLELLQRENLFTVGDELQSIYGFRHADVAIFRARRRSLNGRGAALVLASSFRARPALLDAVNAVFGERFGEAHVPLRPARQTGPRGSAVELLLTDRRGWAESRWAAEIADGLPPAPIWRQAEARLLAQRVAELLSTESVAPGQIAVLLRATGDLPVFERALRDRGVRTLAAVGGFWGQQQVADLLAWLGALANPLDELALYSALASPLVGISSDGLALLAMDARDRGVRPWTALRETGGELYARLSQADGERLAGFARAFVAERRAAPTCSIAQLLLRAVKANGYERHVRALPWGERRLANIHKLLRLARSFEAAEGRDLRGFLDHAAQRDAFAAGGEPLAPTDGVEPDAVRLMSVHAAKGLEFDVVCVADLGRGPGASQPDLLLDGERIGLRLASLDGSQARECLQYAELSAERRGAEAAEEDRILYVAMTRARERLLLSGAVDFARWPADRPGCPPIAWLAPALAPGLAERVGELGDSAAGPSDGPPVRCLLHSAATGLCRPRQA
ncbi:MAG TPA: UvrD-helicase domain-containing protein [Solirubrobacteraceae bacterium]|nr:UvrD-helicase domain-containing protein [Solirubrobacteraceae bacterium]